jgi:hypothetical protein
VECSFHTGSHPSKHARGIAETFDQARGAFEIAWRFFHAKRMEADFDANRRNRAFHAWKQAMSDAGLKLPTQVADGRASVSAVLRSASTMWRSTSTPRTWSPRPHEIRRASPFADPEAAARELLEIANSVEAVQDGRIHIENINGPFLYQAKGSPAEYKAGLDLAIQSGWLWLHESGTYVRFTDTGAQLFA